MTSLPIGLDLLALSTTEQMDWIRSLFLSFYLGAAPPVQVWLRLLGMPVAASALTPPRLLHHHVSSVTQVGQGAGHSQVHGSLLLERRGVLATQGPPRCAEGSGALDPPDTRVPRLLLL
ncbi:hypothetical protein CHARACLAT_017405 [Characodon lateralis]|uniref:Uncharacterized protein n=1 Tax=Characodon lateralis TaxID=208331 RepID=A0ABU7D9M0_9TELE|nr:hypothetical protein [Characodon lateralis]